MEALLLTDDLQSGSSIKRLLLSRYSLECDLEEIRDSDAREFDLISQFAHLCGKIDSVLARCAWVDDCRALPIFVDFEKIWNVPDLFGDLNPMKGDDYAALLAMLVLAYPEAHWIFLWSPLSKALARQRGLVEAVHVWDPMTFVGTDSAAIGPLEWHLAGYQPIFDGAGLRERLFLNIRNLALNFPPQRVASAAAIDDESGYAFMSAYVLYRLGYRSHAVIRKNYMKRLFGEGEGERGGPLQLTFEDMYLNFPDKQGDEHFSMFRERDADNNFPGLRNAKKRIVLTVGHEDAGGKNKAALNRDYLDEIGIANVFLYKPLTGIFDIVRKAKLAQVEGFLWPPSTGRSGTGSHSAPGRLLLIADKLVRRSETLLKTCSSVEANVLGAILAGNAQELLGDRTPTLSLQALDLKHEHEVSAECRFYGVQYHIDVKRRFQNIKDEVRAIVRWFVRKKRRQIELNSRLGIINELALLFRNANQMDEEKECLGEVRRLQSRLALNMKGPAFAPVFLLRRYIEEMLGSLGLFIGVVALLPVLFGMAYLGASGSGWDSFPNMLLNSLVTFFSFNPPSFFLTTAASMTMNVLVALEILAGFVHLGIFIAHVYELLSRR